MLGCHVFRKLDCSRIESLVQRARQIHAAVGALARWHTTHRNQNSANFVLDVTDVVRCQRCKTKRNANLVTSKKPAPIKCSRVHFSHSLYIGFRSRHANKIRTEALLHLPPRTSRCSRPHCDGDSYDHSERLDPTTMPKCRALHVQHLAPYAKKT